MEQPVTGWFYVGCEFNHATQIRLKRLMQKPRHGSLSAVIVDFDATNNRKHVVVRGYELAEGCLESFDHLVGCVDVQFVNGKAMVFVLDFAGKGHHAGENPTSQLAA